MHIWKIANILAKYNPTYIKIKSVSNLHKRLGKTIVIIFISGIHDMNYVHKSHKGLNKTSKKIEIKIKVKKQ